MDTGNHGYWRVLSQAKGHGGAVDTQPHGPLKVWCGLDQREVDCIPANKAPDDFTYRQASREECLIEAEIRSLGPHF